MSKSGNPLPEGARVQAEGGPHQKGPWNSANGALAEDGFFKIEGLTPGRDYPLVVTLGGLGLVLGRAERVAAGTANLLLELDPRGTVQGIVLDAAGDPVGPGVRVGASRSWPGPPYSLMCGNKNPGEGGDTKTRKDGTFTVEFLGDFQFEVCAGRGEGGPGSEVATSSWIPAGSTGLVLRLGHSRPFRDAERGPREPGQHEPAASAISGRLVPALGTAIPHDLALEIVPATGGTRRTLNLPRSGNFDTGTLPEGDYTLRAVTPEGLACGEKSGVASGTRNVEIGIDPHGAISGQVFDSTGRPVEKGVLVVARSGEERGPRRPGSSSSTWTREDGTFILQYLGEYEFTLSTCPDEDRRGDLPGWGEKGVRPGVKGVALKREAPVTISGTVLAPDGTPCNPCDLSARQDCLFGWDRTASDGKGEFSFRRVAAGKVRIVATWEKKEYDLGEFEAPATELRLKIPQD